MSAESRLWTRRNASSGEFTALRRQGVQIDQGRFRDGLAAVLSQLLDLIVAVWRERHCRHRWDEQRTEPACCIDCGTSRKDRR